MKSINFINPVPPKKQKALIWWFYSSLILFILFIAVLSYTYLHQLRYAHLLEQEIRSLKQETAHLDSLIAQKTTLIKDKAFLEERLATLKTFNNSTETPHQLLQIIAAIIPPDVCLTAIQGQPGGTIILEGLAKEKKSATTFLTLLNTCPQLADMRLSMISTQQQDQHKTVIQFKFEGSWMAESSTPLASESSVYGTNQTITAP